MPRVFGDWAEAEGIEESDRARAHREDVADDAADACRRTLVGFDGGGVVVRFDLHHHAQAVANVDCSGVLRTAPGEDVRAFGGEQAEERLRVLVAAVLAPERPEKPELDFVRLAAEAFDDEIVFVAAERDGVEGFLVCGHVFRIIPSYAADNFELGCGWRWGLIRYTEYADRRVRRRNISPALIDKH